MPHTSELLEVTNGSPINFLGELKQFRDTVSSSGFQLRDQMKFVSRTHATRFIKNSIVI
jgi:hypothetical protein